MCFFNNISSLFWYKKIASILEEKIVYHDEIEKCLLYSSLTGFFLKRDPSTDVNKKKQNDLD